MLKSFLNKLKAELVLSAQQAGTSGDHHQSMRNAPASQGVECPQCDGKGAWGTFGPCEQGDIHRKGDCRCCEGRGVLDYPVNKCKQCEGKGGKGTFGPCEQHDIHRKGDCSSCNGKGYLPAYPQHQWGMFGGSQHGGRGGKCPKCDGKGAWGTFGACEQSSIHRKGDCPCCEGRGSVPCSVVPCNTCGGKGGKGTFGPCEQNELHYKGPCPDCRGRGYLAGF
ncbi:hypothetical protein QOT17_016895 [Balamuthia mandrillaris]